jgi:hypothetical protein
MLARDQDVHGVEDRLVRVLSDDLQVLDAPALVSTPGGQAQTFAFEECQHGTARNVESQLNGMDSSSSTTV